jgi:hypothetical protein
MHRVNKRLIEKRAIIDKNLLKGCSWLQLEKLQAVATFAYQLYCARFLSVHGCGLPDVVSLSRLVNE